MTDGENEKKVKWHVEMWRIWRKLIRMRRLTKNKKGDSRDKIMHVETSVIIDVKK